MKTLTDWVAEFNSLVQELQGSSLDAMVCTVVLLLPLPVYQHRACI